MSKTYKAVYSVYKKEDLLFTGTVKEIAEHFNVKINTVYFWSSPACKRRADEGFFKNGKKRIRETTGVKVAVRIDEEMKR